MKHRKSILVVFLLTAAMLMSVGYAALSETLTISGQANFTTTAADNQFKDDVYFTAATPASNKDTATILSDNNRASFTCNSVTLKGETATFTFEITNESLHAANVKIASISVKDLIADGEDSNEDNDEVFGVTTNVPAEGIALPAATDSENFGTCEFTVTVELNGIQEKDPTVAVTGIFDIFINASTVD